MTGSAAESAVTRQAEAAKPEKLGATEHLEVISAPGIEELGQTPEVSKSALLTEKVQFSVWNEEKTALLTETEDGSAALCALPGGKSGWRRAVALGRYTGKIPVAVCYKLPR